MSHKATPWIGSIVQSFHIVHIYTPLYLCLANDTLGNSWLKWVSDQSQDRAASRVLSNIPVYPTVALSVHDALIVFRVVVTCPNIVCCLHKMTGRYIFCNSPNILVIRLTPRQAVFMPKVQNLESNHQTVRYHQYTEGTSKVPDWINHTPGVGASKRSFRAILDHSGATAL